MSFADALYWEREMNPPKPKSPWNNPADVMPKVVINDPVIDYMKTSQTVLVKIKRGTFKEEPYVALAKYTATSFEGEKPTFKWQVEHHTGNWDDKVIGWCDIPLAGE